MKGGGILHLHTSYRYRNKEIQIRNMEDLNSLCVKRMHSTSCCFSKSVSSLVMCFGKVWNVNYCSCFLLVAGNRCLHFTSTFLVVFFPSSRFIAATPPHPSCWVGRKNPSLAHSVLTPWLSGSWPVLGVDTGWHA